MLSSKSFLLFKFPKIFSGRVKGFLFFKPYISLLACKVKIEEKIVSHFEFTSSISFANEVKEVKHAVFLF